MAFDSFFFFTCMQRCSAFKSAPTSGMFIYIYILFVLHPVHCSLILHMHIFLVLTNLCNRYVPICLILQILMSASFDAERFSQYFGVCPIIYVPGLTYPVCVQYSFVN